MAPIVGASLSRGAWPCPGTVRVLSREWRARISASVVALRMSEFCPRMTSTGTRASALNCGHSSGIGPSTSDMARARLAS